jgi:hypothetical protein
MRARHRPDLHVSALRADDCFQSRDGRCFAAVRAVPADLLARTSELAPYLAKSYNYAKSLKPKPTTRRR